MVKKLAPRKVKVCPVCHGNDLTLDVTPQFKFAAEHKNDTKKITIIDNVKSKIKGRISTLF